MAQVLYFDTFCGASGDMILGALLDLGLPLAHLREELGKLGVEGFELTAEKVVRQGLRGTDFRVRVSSDVPSQARGPAEISRLIESSGLDGSIQDRALAIFRRLGEAEAKVHGTSPEAVHFHEVGAVDAIVDVVGACVGFHYFGVDRFYTAPLVLGHGTVEFSHGKWPVPAPATAELVRGFPVVAGRVSGEMTTPTGAAIICTLVDQNAEAPVFRYQESGFGAGDREIEEVPNLLRLILGKVEEAGADLTADEAVDQQSVLLLEAAIDNMDAEMLGHFMARALSEGVLDVYYSPLYMKKNRPGVLLTLLCRCEDRDRMLELIFRETTTLGVRWTPWRRCTLDREIRRVETGFGPVGVKIGRFRGRIVNVWPEYEDLREVALKQKLPLKWLRQKVLEDLGNVNYE